MKKDYIIEKQDGERRFFSSEIRAAEEGVIEGIAAVVNNQSDLGWYEERIDRGAFDDVLTDDVVALFNHDANLPLARTTAEGDGKLDIFLTKEGHLGYRFKMPNTQMGKDLAENIRSGIVKQSSFAFTIAEDSWEFASSNEKLDKDVRTIKKVKRLYDVSPVTYPAYADTSVGARSAEHALDASKEVKEKIGKDKADRDAYYRNKYLKNRNK
jgi:uncharacterized protein